MSRWVQEDDGMVKVRPGWYRTTDDRFQIRRYAGQSKPWVIEARDSADDVAAELLRPESGTPAAFRTLDEAQVWLFCSIYDHLRDDGYVHGSVA